MMVSWWLVPANWISNWKISGVGQIHNTKTICRSSLPRAVSQIDHTHRPNFQTCRLFNNTHWIMSSGARNTDMLPVHLCSPVFVFVLRKQNLEGEGESVCCAWNPWGRFWRVRPSLWKAEVLGRNLTWSLLVTWTGPRPIVTTFWSLDSVVYQRWSKGSIGNMHDLVSKCLDWGFITQVTMV